MDELKKLEKTGKYLFHGSINGDTPELHPRQAMSFQQPDGEPAVFASEAVEPPIFMAVLGSHKLGGWNNKDFHGFGFYISDVDMKQAIREGWKGYVYILRRDTFVKLRDFEWRSETIVKPIKVIEVGIDDLPEPIQIVTEDEYNSISRGRK